MPTAIATNLSGLCFLQQSSLQPRFPIRWVITTVSLMVLQIAYAAPDNQPLELSVNEITVASIERRLKSLGPSPGMKTEDMITLIQLDRKALDWETISHESVLCWTELEGGKREIAMLSARKNANDASLEGRLQKLSISDRKYMETLLVWTPEGGLQVPESARQDPKAKYLVDQPVPIKSLKNESGWFSTPGGRRAAAWHDERYSDWNSQMRASGDSGGHRRSADEVGLVQGTYTVRIPHAYVSDGSWGCILYFSLSTGPYLSVNLRNACDKHKLLYVGLQPSSELIGYHWAHADYILRCMSDVKLRFGVSNARTMLADDEDSYAVLFAGMVHPEMFGALVLLRGQAIPTGLSSPYMEGKSSIPLDWMDEADWRRNRELGQRIGMTWSEPLHETRLSATELEAQWQHTGIPVHMITSSSIEGHTRKLELREPRRSVLAEFIGKVFGNP